MGKRAAKPPKKLKVKKETLRKLDAQELEQAHGGVRTSQQTYLCAAAAE